MRFSALSLLGMAVWMLEGGLARLRGLGQRASRVLTARRDR